MQRMLPSVLLTIDYRLSEFKLQVLPRGTPGIANIHSHPCGFQWRYQYLSSSVIKDYWANT